MDYTFLKAIPGSIMKPEPRKKTKARAKRRQATYVDEVRVYVFGRERNICRCCRFREAHSMHEIRFRSLGGKISKSNSIAVCGTGTTLCHGLLQQGQIQVMAPAEHGVYDAERTLWFQASTVLAAEHLRVRVGQWIGSPPMIDTEMAK